MINLSKEDIFKSFMKLIISDVHLHLNSASAMKYASYYLMVQLSVTVNLLNFSDYTGGLPGAGAHGPHQQHSSKLTGDHN